MAKLQYVDELAKSIKSKNKRININNDDAYIESVLQTQLEQSIQTYLSNSDNDNGDRKKLRIEIKPDYVDNFLDLIENHKMSDTVIFRQIQPTIFELELKDLNLF